MVGFLEGHLEEAQFLGYSSTPGRCYRDRRDGSLLQPPGPIFYFQRVTGRSLEFRVAGITPTSIDRGVMDAGFNRDR